MALFSGLIAFSQEQNYDITFNVKGISNEMALLGYNFIDNKYIQDSIYFNESGIGKFKGKYNIPPGVYLLAFRSLQNKYFEFVLNETSFSLETDTTDFIENMVIKNSKENTMMYTDLRYMIKFGNRNKDIGTQLDALPLDSPERKVAEEESKSIYEAKNTHRAKLVKENPRLLYSRLIMAMTDVKVPENAPELKTDSLYAFHYLKAHYFDNVDPADSAICRTPVLYMMITNYIKDYIFPHPDTISRAVDDVITKFNTSNLMYEGVLKGYMRYFANSQMMVHEPVYVHIAREYFLKGKAPWADSAGLEKLAKRINEILPSMLYTNAPDFLITDTAGNKFPLSQILSQGKQEYLILSFWNSECSHCKVEIPELTRIYDEQISKLPYKVTVVSVGTDKELEKIKKFLIETKETAFITGYDPSSWFSVLYDVKSTPMIFVIDNKGKIIAKHIPVDKIYEFIKDYNSTEKG